MTDELGLGLGVGLTVVLEPVCELALERDVDGRQFRLAPQLVAECQLLLEAWRADRNEMEMMSPASGVGLAEPVHDLAEVGRVDVFELGQPREAAERAAQVLDADEDVDHRLRVEPWHRGAADVVDAADRPLADRRFECLPLLGEPLRPAGVVANDLDRRVNDISSLGAARPDARIMTSNDATFS
jgi:hypothetical protein